MLQRGQSRPRGLSVAVGEDELPERVDLFLRVVGLRERKVRSPIAVLEDEPFGLPLLAGPFALGSLLALVVFDPRLFFGRAVEVLGLDGVGHLGPEPPRFELALLVLGRDRLLCRFGTVRVKERLLALVL